MTYTALRCILSSHTLSFHPVTLFCHYGTQAPGLSLLPFHLLAGAKSLPATVEDLETQLDLNRERQNTILNRYPMSRGAVGGGGAGGRHQLSDRNRHLISELAQEELLLENRLRLVLRIRDSCWNQCLCIIRPFQVNQLKQE